MDFTPFYRGRHSYAPGRQLEPRKAAPISGRFDAIPVRDPLRRLEVERNDIRTRQQHAVIGARRVDEIGAAAGIGQGPDHRVDGRVGDACVVEGPGTSRDAEPQRATCSTPGEREAVYRKGTTSKS